MVEDAQRRVLSTQIYMKWFPEAATMEKDFEPRWPHFKGHQAPPAISIFVFGTILLLRFESLKQSIQKQGQVKVRDAVRKRIRLPVSGP